MPTYSKIERIQRDQNHHIVRSVSHGASLVGTVSSHMHFEGRSSAITREDKSVHAVKFAESSSAVEIGPVKAIDFDSDYVMSKLIEIANGFVEDLDKNFISAISDAADESGNVIDGKGKPFSPEMLLESLEKMAPTYNAQGKWEPPIIALPPSLMKKLQEQDTEEIRRKFDRKLEKIKAKKFDEYRVRETGRKLVG